MIFVTLGTQDKDFSRLLEAIEQQIQLGKIKDNVIVQAGYTKYQSPYMEIFDFISMEAFQTYVAQSDLIITHGGVGSILASLQLRKKVIAVARLKAFGEHENDHQTEIVSHFHGLGYVLGCLNVEAIGDALVAVEAFAPVPYRSNNEQFCELIREKIG